MLSPCHLCALVGVAACILLLDTPLHAQQVVASAVDAAGKRHLGSREFPGGDAPWIHDRLKFVAPVYSYGDRLTRRQGVGLFRLYIDLKTGLVTHVAVVKSTGFWSLDTSAVNALNKWRWRPGRWKEVDVPLRFVMGSGG
jgi:TonB family protein